MLKKQEQKRVKKACKGNVFIVCLLFLDDITEATLPPLLKLLEEYKCSVFQMLQPETINVCFSEFIHEDYFERAESFIEHVIKTKEFSRISVGFDSGEALIPPASNRNMPHGFPVGEVCNEAGRKARAKRCD
jgi:hypothetical protein